MKTIVLAVLLLFSSCGGPQQPRCEDLETVCEYNAWRQPSIVSSWFSARDCALDFGQCLYEEGYNCEVSCDFAALPSPCRDACEERQ